MATINMNIAEGRVDAYAKLWGTEGGLDDMGSLESASLNITSEPIEVKSNGKVAGVVYASPGDVTAELSLGFRDLTAKNLAYAMSSAISNVVAGTKTETITLEEGQTIFLEGFDQEIDTFGTLVQDEDYTLDVRTGALTALTDITAQACTYDYSAFSEIGIAVGKPIYLTVRLEQANTGKVWEIYKWALTPGSVELISNGSPVVTTAQGKCLADATKSFNAELGQVGKIKVKATA